MSCVAIAAIMGKALTQVDPEAIPDRLGRKRYSLASVLATRNAPLKQRVCRKIIIIKQWVEPKIKPIPQRKRPLTQ
jgi:hypothetical protein